MLVIITGVAIVTLGRSRQGAQNGHAAITSLWVLQKVAESKGGKLDSVPKVWAINFILANCLLLNL